MPLLKDSLVPLLAAWSGNPHHNRYYDPSRPHHTPAGFRNNYPHGRPSREDFARWNRERRAAGLPRPPTADLSCVAPDLDFIHANRGDDAVSWVGHATVLLQTAGANVLTDPVFSARCSPLAFVGPKRHQPPGIALHQLPRIDLVVISHNHYDHLDWPSIRALAHQRGGPPLFAAPLGVDLWLRHKLRRAWHSHVAGLDWWQHTATAGLRAMLVPVQHWSARTPFDRNATLWGGWIVEAPRFRFFFSGDLGYSQDTRDIGERCGPVDLAAIGIGAYEPRWFMRNQHINPEEAVRVHLDLKARRSLGIHWGTFGLTDEALDQPPRDLAAARRRLGVTDDEFFVLRHGETRRL